MISKEDRQELYDMFDSGHYTMQEVADWLGINISTVKRYIHNRKYLTSEYEQRKKFLTDNIKKGSPAMRKRYAHLLNILEECWRKQNGIVN